MLPACRVRSLDRVGRLVILPALGALEQLKGRGNDGEGFRFLSGSPRAPKNASFEVSSILRTDSREREFWTHDRDTRSARLHRL